MLPSPAELRDLLSDATPEELQEALALIGGSPTPVWIPLPGPQKAAAESPADILFYGGSGGSGKTDLILGLALTAHKKTAIFRKQATELPTIIDRLTVLVGGRDGFNGTEKIWKIPRRVGGGADRSIEFGSCPNPGDQEKYRGRDSDAKFFDEITAFTEAEFRFICAWLRTTDKNQRCRVICTGNPPATLDGQWVIKFFAPWLDPDHPNPAEPGELRWFVMVDGVEVERPNSKPFMHNGKKLTPKSRTFIPGTVEDNPFLMETGYDQTLESLPEPIRSQMRYGNFHVDSDDPTFQVLPTSWVKAAQERWTSDGGKGQRMSSMGVDVSRGGKDRTCICQRYGKWYGIPKEYPGSFVTDGNAAAGLVFLNLKDAAPVHIDIINCGTSAYDHLKNNGIHTVAINGSAKGNGTDRSGLLRFYNKRAEIYWKFREALDPAFGSTIALPPGAAIRKELCAATWKLTVRFDGKGILIESKDDIKSRLGVSPDLGESILYASVDTPRPAAGGRQQVGGRSSSSEPSSMCA